MNNKTDRELLEENNQMLREIVGFIREVRKGNEKDKVESLIRNVIANIIENNIIYIRNIRY